MHNKKILFAFLCIACIMLVGANCQKTEEKTEENNNQPTEQKVEKTTEKDIFANAPVITLKDVTGNNATGKAWIAYEDGKTYHKVVAKNMPELQNEDFYEGWLTKDPSSLGFFSTGKMYFDKTENAWILEYEVDEDKSEYPNVVITLEPNDDNPAPAKHIIEN